MSATVQAERQTAPGGSEWLVFACAGHRLGLPVGSVREVVPGRPATRLPGCGPAVLGLVSLRGRIVTAFDLGATLGLAASADAAEHWLLVLERQDQVVAVAVESVITLTASAELEPVPGEDETDAAAPGGHSLAAVREDAIGVGTLEDGHFVAVDPERILGRLLA